MMEPSSSQPQELQKTEADDTTNDFSTGLLTASWMRNALERLDPKMYLYEFLQQGTRPDGRCFHQARPTRLVKGILGRSKPTTNGTLSKHYSHSNIAGSAMIHLGNTVVLSAVTLQVGQPMAGCHSEWGDLVVQMELANTTSSSSPFLSKTAQWVQGRLLQSQLLDLSQLCLVPGYAAWRIHLTLLIVQDDGNVKDASLLAAVAALLDTRLPATQLQNTMISNSSTTTTNNNHTTASGAPTRAVVTTLLDQPSLPLVVTTEHIPVALTMALYQDESHTITSNEAPHKRHHLVVDPTTLEESWIRDKLTLVVTSTSTNSANDILHLSHHGVMDTSSLTTAWHLAKGRAQEVRDLLLPPEQMHE